MSKSLQAASLFKKVTFLRGAAALVQCPTDGVPEIAFSGRSNVGKSSLINALCGAVGKTKLARVSKTPGRTQELNFFSVGNSFRLVDLPGYGFARAPRAKHYKWNATTEQYLLQRSPDVLRMVYVLLDSRRGVMEIDVQWMAMLKEGNVHFKLLFTKSDRVSKSQLGECISGGLAQLATIHGRPSSHGEDLQDLSQHVLTCSSKNKIGLNSIRRSILSDTVDV